MDERTWLRRLLSNEQAIAGIVSAFIVGLFGLTAATISRGHFASSAVTPSSSPFLVTPAATAIPTPTTSPSPLPTSTPPRPARPSPMPTAPPSPNTSSTLSAAPAPAPIITPPVAVSLPAGQRHPLPGGTWWVCTGDLTLARPGQGASSLAPTSSTDGLLLIVEPTQTVSVQAQTAGQCDPAPSQASQRTAVIQAKISDLLHLGCESGCKRVKVVDEGTLQTTYWVSR